MRALGTVGAAAALLLLPGGLGAQVSEGGRFELGALASYSRYDESGSGALADYGVGARAAWFLTRMFSLEVGASRTLTRHPALPRTVAVTEGSATALANLWVGDRNQLFVGTGYSWLLYTGSLEFSDHALRGVVGDRVLLSRMAALRVEGAAAYAPTTNAPTASGRGLTFTVSAGISFFLGARQPRDRDDDLVPDRYDRCAATPALVVVDAAGCPRDSDGDRVFDGIDRCQNTPAGASVDAAGCLLDIDADGVPDYRDACPSTPAGTAVGENGCALDGDGDGVVDDLDQCPATAADVPVDGSGCPRDTDADGIPDHLDRCAGTPAGQPVDELGCTILFEEREGERQPLVLQGVNFELNEATLTPESFTVLEQVAASLVANPDVRVEVGGHTDSQGNAALNAALSLRRAEAVRDYLISQGVEPERLVARGYGPDEPRASNDTEDGRAQNRRVELRLIER